VARSSSFAAGGSVGKHRIESRKDSSMRSADDLYISHKNFTVLDPDPHRFDGDGVGRESNLTKSEALDRKLPYRFALRSGHSYREPLNTVYNSDIVPAVGESRPICINRPISNGNIARLPG
jgi:hypothetical protein